MITVGYGDFMNNVYHFDWVVNEIDQSIILKLVDGDKVIGLYQVSEFGYDLGKIDVKFAAVNDLTNLLTLSTILFRDVSEEKNTIRIPLRKALLLFSRSNKIGEKKERSINIKDLEAFIVRDGELLKGNYQICAYQVNHESEELKELMEAAYDFGNLGMTETIEALKKVNLLNYHKMNGGRSA